MSITLKRLFQIWERRKIDSGQAWGVGVSVLKKFFLPTDKPNNLIVYNAGGRLGIAFVYMGRDDKKSRVLKNFYLSTNILS
jgi:hypothetical protein